MRKKFKFPIQDFRAIGLYANQYIYIRDDLKVSISFPVIRGMSLSLIWMQNQLESQLCPIISM